MFKKIIALSTFIITFSGICYSECVSFAKSGSGQLTPGGYYSYSVFQSVFFRDGKVLSESHSFTFIGALFDDAKPSLLGINDKWMIYEGKNHYIAIPCVLGECIYVLNKISNTIPSPGQGTGTGQEKKEVWQKISSPIN